MQDATLHILRDFMQQEDLASLDRLGCRGKCKGSGRGRRVSARRAPNSIGSAADDVFLALDW